MYMILILILTTQAIKNDLPFVFKRLSIWTTISLNCAVLIVFSENVLIM